MKLTKSGPLTDREIDWLEEILMKYGMDDSVLCFSELDGLLTAILSGPNMVSPNIWLSAIWGRGDYHRNGHLRERWSVLSVCVFSI